MSTNKSKPKSCDVCPAVKVEKGTLICKCMPILKASTSSKWEKTNMWNKCPIDWR